MSGASSIMQNESFLAIIRNGLSVFGGVGGVKVVEFSWGGALGNWKLCELDEGFMDVSDEFVRTVRACRPPIRLMISA